MSNSPEFKPENPFAVLRQFARRQRRTAERCELCSAEVFEGHPHLLDRSSRQVLCACGPCALLFPDQQNARYRRIPTRIKAMPDFQMTEIQWESLMLPINLAFFYRDSTSGKVVAMYPSPAGATESLLSLEAWDEIVGQNPGLQSMESDVEALLVNRVDPSADYFVVPIDECYRLVGLIRTHWRGLSGGATVWKEIQGFFVSLKARCNTPRRTSTGDSGTKQVASA